MADRTHDNTVDPPHITEFASVRYFEKLKQLRDQQEHQQQQERRDEPLTDTASKVSTFILPLREPKRHELPIDSTGKTPRTKRRVFHSLRRKIAAIPSSSTAKPALTPRPSSANAADKSLPFEQLFFALPNELQIQIISSLPLNRLLSLRLVSRAWHALIALNEAPIARYQLNDIPAFAKRLYPMPNSTAIGFSYLCGQWHRLHVAAKLSYLISDWAMKEIFLRQTEAQQQSFATQRERMRRRLIPLLFTIFHFFESYRKLHVQYILENGGNGLQRIPYTLNPIEVQIMNMYDDQTLLRVHEIFPLFMSSFCRRLRPPTYAHRLERSLMGYLKTRPPDDVHVAIVCIGGLRQVLRLWDINGYNQRRDAVDEWYANINNENDIAEGAGIPMGKLDGKHLRILIPDLPMLQQIWVKTGEALIIDRNIVHSAQEIKRNQRVLLELIRGGTEEEEEEEEWWYGQPTPEWLHPAPDNTNELQTEPNHDRTQRSGQEDQHLANELHGQPAVQQPAIQQPAIQEPAIQEPATQQPATQGHWDQGISHQEPTQLGDQGNATLHDIPRLETPDRNRNPLGGLENPPSQHETRQEPSNHASTQLGDEENTQPQNKCSKEASNQDKTQLGDKGNPSPQSEPGQEPPQFEDQEATSSFLSVVLAACWYACMRILDPPGNSKRITYTCGCGDLRYLDVEELVPGGADELQRIIRADATAVRKHRPAQAASSSNLPAVPPQVHLTTVGQQYSHMQGRPVQDLQSHGPNGQGTSDTSSANGSLMPASGVSRLKYLILCINTKRGLVTPQHLDVSSVTNDQYLFECIKTAYSDVRRGHEWNLATLLPESVGIPGWLLRLLSITPPKQIQLPGWLVYYLQNCSFFIPKKAEFVQFQLMPVRKEIYAGNMVKPEVPGQDEVLVKRTYEYRPIPLKVKIMSIPFFHELLRPGEHLGLFWWNRFPKKLDGTLVWDEDAECMGWGIHITEGWNKALISVLALLLMSSFGIFVVVYWALTHDGSTGAGIGSFMIAFLTLFCWLRYEGWKSG